MSFTLRTSLMTALLALAATVTLVACNKTETTTPGEKLDSAISDAKSAADKAQGEAHEAVKNTEAAAAYAAKSLSEGAADVTITTKIKAALAADDQLRVMSISVDTVQGKVTLTGTAPDESSKTRAKTLASAVTGVTDVDNRLVVGSAS
jgi:osmotically-inducible protein OsmY